MEGEIKSYKNKFNQYGESEFANMCDDFTTIVKGKARHNELNIDSKNHAPIYSEKEKSMHNKRVLESGIKATEYMTKESDFIKAKNYQDQSELPIYRNQSNIYASKNPQTKYSSIYSRYYW